LIAEDGDQSYIPLVVRDDVGTHDFVFEHAATTDQAYNAWGGKSLYDFNSVGDPTVGGTKAAVKVSYDRPFNGDGSGGNMLDWELNMVRWLEANGFDVSYVSDVDVHANPEFAARARAVLQVGHNEYWSKEMRDHLEAARDAGKGLGFFSGNTGSWAIRFEDSPLGKDRVQVCYKSRDDPLAVSDPARATTHWWEPPVNRPTRDLMGLDAASNVRRSGDWTAEGVEAAPDLFVDTGLRNGDVVPNLVGYEYDGLWTRGAEQLPPNLIVLGRARVLPVYAPSALLDFAAEYEWAPGTRPPFGQLSAAVETIQDSPAWHLALHLVSGDRRVSLVYAPGTGRPSKDVSGREEVGSFPLGEEFFAPGWRSVERDLRADYASVLGTPPDDLEIESVTLHGSLSLGTLSFSAVDGATSGLAMGRVATPEAAGWRVKEGHGALFALPAGPSGQPAVGLRVANPDGRRPDEAHTIALRTSVGGLVVSVGSIQWSWALDGYGRHTDDQHHETKVDARIQALTRNLLRALRQEIAS
jgi:hypothetical protein